MNLEQSIHISASILAADFANLAKAVRDAEESGIDSIHIDIMDGHYVHNLAFGLSLLPALRRHTALPLIAHLEIDNPDSFVGDFARAGANMIIVCEDTCPDLSATIRAVRTEGVQVGVSLNPDRPVEFVRDYLGQLDHLLILAVFPGFGGQKFNPSVLPKIAAARELLDDMATPPTLGVDGGVNFSTLADVLRAGADTLIMGSAIYARGDVARNAHAVRGLIRTVRAS